MKCTSLAEPMQRKTFAFNLRKKLFLLMGEANAYAGQQLAASFLEAGGEIQTDLF